MDECTRNRVLNWLQARYFDGPIRKAKIVAVYTADGVKDGAGEEVEHVVLNARRFHAWILSCDLSVRDILGYCFDRDWIHGCLKPPIGHVSDHREYHILPAVMAEDINQEQGESDPARLTDKETSKSQKSDWSQIDPDGKISYRDWELRIGGEKLFRLRRVAGSQNDILQACEDNGWDGETVYLETNAVSSVQSIRDAVAKLNRKQKHLEFYSDDAEFGGVNFRRKPLRA